jgi:hypothetical protein
VVGGGVYACALRLSSKRWVCSDCSFFESAIGVEVVKESLCVVSKHI